MKQHNCSIFPIRFAVAIIVTSLFGKCQRISPGRSFDVARIGSQQLPNLPSSNGVCQNGGQFTGAYCSGERLNECGVLYQQRWTAICISGRCCTNPVKYVDDGGWDRDNDFERGRAVCLRYGGRYSRTECKRASNCGPYDYSACISGYCCFLRDSATKWDNNNNKRRRQKQWDDEEYTEDGQVGIGTRRYDGVRRPNGVAGFCYRNPRFPLFMGHFCSYDGQCPPAFDHSASRPISIWTRCIEGVCCGESIERGGNRMILSDDRTGGRSIGTSNGLIPNRLSEAFCYEGTRTKRQCFSSVDCHHEESCVNELCCPRGTDEMNYACGGLASNGSCGPNGQCVVAGKRLQCVSSGVCCECPLGQPQPGVNDCSATQQQCREGYYCHNNGFCCPQCAGGKRPFGSCNKGRCAPNFACRPGNICCEERIGELAIGTESEENNWRQKKKKRTTTRRRRLGEEEEESIDTFTNS